MKTPLIFSKISINYLKICHISMNHMPYILKNILILNSKPLMHTIITSMVIPQDQYSPNMKTAMASWPEGSIASSCQTGELRQCPTASRERGASLSMSDTQVITEVSVQINSLISSLYEETEWALTIEVSRRNDLKSKTRGILTLWIISHTNHSKFN